MGVLSIWRKGWLSRKQQGEFWDLTGSRTLSLEPETLSGGHQLIWSWILEEDPGQGDCDGENRGSVDDVDGALCSTPEMTSLHSVCSFASADPDNQR